MWINFLTIKMKNIGSNKISATVFRMLKKDKYFGIDGIEVSESKEKNEVIFYTYDGVIDERPIRKFSKKFKDEMIQVSSIRVHNPFSRKPDEPKEESLYFYKNGMEILEIRKGYKIKIKPIYYKISPKYYNYKKLIIVTTAEKIFDIYGNDKETLVYFKIDNKTVKKDEIRIPFMELIKFEKYCRYDELILMEDINEYNETEITKQEFMAYFTRKELSLFDKDIK